VKLPLSTMAMKVRNWSTSRRAGMGLPLDVRIKISDQ
jgi:hypothetical protein